MRILGLVLARGGSKGVPRKNVRMLAGKPVLAWTAQAARDARSLARRVLSTDDEEIARVGREWGLETPFMRPAELARDDTPSLPVMQHAVRFLEEQGDRFDAVCLLQPTAPMRTAAMIDEACKRFAESGADCLVSVMAIPHHHHPHWALLADENGRLSWASGSTAPPPRRQTLPPAWHREGSIYITRTEVLLAGSLYGRAIVGLPVDPADSVNIDTMDDLAEAERRLAERGN